MKKYARSDIYGVRQKSEENGTKTKIRHSSYYHRYFEGYTEVVEPDGSIKRKYTAEWIIQDLTEEQRKRVKAVYIGLNVLSIVLFSLAMTRPTAANSSLLVAVTGLPAILMLIMTAAFSLVYLTNPRQMTRYEGDRGKKLSVSALVTAVLYAATAVLTVAYCVFVQHGAGAGEIAAIGLLFLAAAVIYCVRVIEKRIPYTEKPNDAVLPKDGTMIRR